ncbi:AAA family ATPase [Thiomonas sp.]
METTIINLFGAPGSGKSTCAAHVFASLREQGVAAEFVPEYAKELVWFDNKAELADQLSIFAEQHRRIIRVFGKVEYILTDGPLLNSILFQPEGYPELFTETVLAFHARFPRQKNYLLKRTHSYEKAGRQQTEEDAVLLGHKLEGILHRHIPGQVTTLPVGQAVSAIMADLLAEREAEKALSALGQCA